MTLNLHTMASALFASSLLLASSAGAAVLSKADYSAGKTRISADYKAAKEACSSLSANAKDICVEEGRAVEKVARAELEFNYNGSARNQNKVLVAKADAVYAVAKEKCDDLAGNDKKVCVTEAKATHTKALADAKLAREVGGARADASADRNDADYRVAAQKCGDLAGEAKDSCLNAAKARFGKG